MQQAIVPPAIFVQSAADSAGRAEDAAAGSEASDPALAVAVQSSASITPQEARSDPIGDLVAATVAETPEPDSARESAAAPQPSEPVPDQEPNRPAQAASSSQDVDGAAAGNSAGPPALAFGAEPATSRKHATRLRALVRLVPVERRAGIAAHPEEPLGICDNVAAILVA